MAILGIEEIATGRWSRSEAFPYRLEYGRRFIVVSDTKLETEANVKAAGPTLGTPHPDDSFAVCVMSKATQVKKRHDHWYLDCRYSSTWDQIETETDPSDFRDHVRIGTIYHERPLVKDAVTGQAVVNKAGDPFDPPLMVEYALTSLVVTKNYGSMPTWLLSHRNKRNNAPLTIRGVPIDTGQGRIREVELSDEKHSNALPYFQARIEVEVDDVTEHVAQVLNDGLNQLVLNNDTGVYEKRACFVGPEVAQEPQPLDSNGTQIDATLLPGAAVVLGWNRYALDNWAVINFPP